MSDLTNQKPGIWEQLHETVYDEHIHWRDLLDERQKKEIDFSAVYARDFSHGTDGHNAKLIIAKLAALLDSVQENITFYSDADQHRGQNR